ncbi:MAG: hypothetical protein Q9163_004757 [Psora crenata]
MDNEVKPIGRTNSGTVILFDLATQTITTQKKKRIPEKKIYKYEKPAPRFGNRVKIFEGAGSSLLVASLNLDKLGWGASLKRLCGKCNDIYVMDIPDEDDSNYNAPAATAA